MAGGEQRAHADALPTSGAAHAPTALDETAQRAKAEELLRRGSLHEAQAAIVAGEAATSSEHRRCGAALSSPALGRGIGAAAVRAN
jgi:hypothetical protein